MNTIKPECGHVIMTYGTLKPGHGNNHVITGRGHVDLGRCRTLNAYLLNDGFPFVWEIDGTSPLYARYAGYVVGHLYAVDDECLAACDRLEGHPRFYKRTDITVTQAEGDEWVRRTAAIYFAQSDPKEHQLQLPRNGLLEWGRDERERAMRFQRRKG